MADLKIGTTVGGSSIWTQSNFPLFPTGNSLLYRNYTIYSTNDKPQAADNDFVSKALGGAYLGSVSFLNSNSSTQMMQIQGTAAGIQLSTSDSSGVLTGNNYQIYAQGDLLRFRGPNGTGLIDLFQWNNLTKQLEVRGSVRLLQGSFLDSSGNTMYGPQNKPTASDVGAVSLATGGTVKAEIISEVSNNFRLSNGTKSVFQRIDTGYQYFMISDSPTGSYNNLRPFSINLSNGQVLINHGLSLANGMSVSGGVAATGNISVTGSISATSNISSAGNITSVNTYSSSSMKLTNGTDEFGFSGLGSGQVNITRSNPITRISGASIGLYNFGTLHVNSVNSATGVSTATQGMHMMWNESGGAGEGAIVVNPGGGAGGLYIRFINSANTVETGKTTIGADGTIRTTGNIVAANNLYAANGNTTFNSDGNINGSIYGGWLTNWVNNRISTEITSYGSSVNSNCMADFGRGGQQYRGSARDSWEAPAGCVLTGRNNAVGDGRDQGIYFRQLIGRKLNGTTFGIGDFA